MGFSEKSSVIKKALDNMALKLYGRTISSSLKNKICVICGRNIYTVKYNMREYEISALCDQCFNEATLRE